VEVGMDIFVIILIAIYVKFKTRVMRKSLLYVPSYVFDRSCQLPEELESSSSPHAVKKPIVQITAKIIVVSGSWNGYICDNINSYLF